MPATAPDRAATYTGPVRWTFLARTVIVVVPMPPQALDPALLETALGLDRPRVQVANEQMALFEYDRLRLLATEGRVQLEFPNAQRDQVRRATEVVLEFLESFNPSAVGFNGVVRGEADSEIDQEPLRSVVHLEALAQRLATDTVRVGLKGIYPGEDGSRITFSLEPDPSALEMWLVQVNRHYDGLPEGEARSRAISWLAAADHELRQMSQRIIRTDNRADEEAETSNADAD